MDLKDIRLGFALTGSFCTLQAAFEQMEKLVEMGAKVQPVMSEMVYQTDTRFGAARTFIERAEALCGCPVMHRITETETIGPKNLLDAMLVAPCTGNTLGKLAHRDQRHRRHDGGEGDASEQKAGDCCGFNERRPGRKRQEHRHAFKYQGLLFCAGAAGRLQKEAEFYYCGYG